MQRSFILIYISVLISLPTLGDTLPVELIYFLGDSDSSGINLNWGTATEVNNYGYNIERSSDQVNWNVIGFVPGHGNSSSPKDYSFTDSEITENGFYYYRLMQIDTDGGFEYTDIVEVEYNFITAIKLTDGGIQPEYSLSQNYPNPFNPSTTIEFTLHVSADIRLELCSITGQTLRVLLDENLPAGTHQTTLYINDFSSGVYVYCLITPQITLSRKIIFIK